MPLRLLPETLMGQRLIKFAHVPTQRGDVPALSLRDLVFNRMPPDWVQRRSALPRNKVLAVITRQPLRRQDLSGLGPEAKDGREKPYGASVPVRLEDQADEQIPSRPRETSNGIEKPHNDGEASKSARREMTKLLRAPSVNYTRPYFESPRNTPQDFSFQQWRQTKACSTVEAEGAQRVAAPLPQLHPLTALKLQLRARVRGETTLVLVNWHNHDFTNISWLAEHSEKERVRKAVCDAAIALARKTAEVARARTIVAPDVAVGPAAAAGPPILPSRWPAL